MYDEILNCFYSQRSRSGPHGENRIEQSSDSGPVELERSKTVPGKRVPTTDVDNRLP